MYSSDNPFEENPGTTSAPAPPPKPTSMRPQSQAPTQSPPQSFGYHPDPQMASKAERLRKMEEELNRKEEMLDKRQQILLEREGSNKDPRAPNWPRCRPLLYHDIAEDIKDPILNRYVKMGYIGWLIFVFATVWNVVCLAAVLSFDAGSTAVGDFILGIIFFFLLNPIFFLVYRQLYKAGRHEKKATRYVLFLCTYFFQILTQIYFFIGVQGTGAGGFFLMIDAFDADNQGAAFMLLAEMIIWGGLSVFSIYLWIVVRMQYKRRTGGLDAAKKEMTASAIDEAKKNPELFQEGAKQGYRFAEENPELVVKGVKAAV